MYTTVAGINIDEQNPGYKHIIIAPQPGGTLTQASASRNVAMLGKWHRTGRAGHDLVIPSLDLRPHARGHIVNLTPKGRLVAAALEGLMEE